MAKTTKQQHGIGGNHFSASARRTLLRAGIRIIGITNLPNAQTGSFANGETGYELDDNGTGRIRTYGQMSALIANAKAVRS